MEKPEFLVIQLVVISVSLVGVLCSRIFTGIHEVVLFVVGLFFCGNFSALHFQKRKYGEKMGLGSLLFAITINIFSIRSFILF